MKPLKKYSDRFQLIEKRPSSLGAANIQKEVVGNGLGKSTFFDGRWGTAWSHVKGSQFQRDIGINKRVSPLDRTKRVVYFPHMTF